VQAQVRQFNGRLLARARNLCFLSTKANYNLYFFNDQARRIEKRQENVLV